MGDNIPLHRAASPGLLRRSLRSPAPQARSKLTSESQPKRPHQLPPEQAKQHASGGWRVPLSLAAVLAALLMALALYAAWSGGTQRFMHHLVHMDPSAAFCARSQVHTPRVCAHGGDTSEHPPNTLGAYAASSQADCIEVDVSLSADGELVNMHNRDLQLLLKQPGVRVASFSAAQLRALRWPGGQAVLSVSQALAAVQSRVPLVVLDVKVSPTGNRAVKLAGAAGSTSEVEALVQRLLQLLAASRCAHCMVWAKSDAFVRRFKQAAPHTAAGFVVMSAPGTNLHDPGRLPEADVAAVYHRLLDARLAARLHAARKRVFAWTVNDAAELKRLLDLGVDGFVTNLPLVLSEAIALRLAKCAAADAHRRGVQSSRRLLLLR